MTNRQRRLVMKYRDIEAEQRRIAEVTAIEKLLDPCASRHGGNEESREANRRNLHRRSIHRRLVFDLIAERPRSMKEIARVMGVDFSTVSGRGSELRYMGCVRPTGEKRDGSAVLEVCGEYHD